MANGINWWKPGGILSQQQYFDPTKYGEKGSEITTPTLLGAGVLGDVPGKKGKIRRWNEISCPAGTQPNASNTACVPIQKTKVCPDGSLPPCGPSGSTTTETTQTCAQRGLVPDGMGGCKLDDGTTTTTTTTTTNDGCIYGQDKYGNCIDPTGGSDWYDVVAPGMEPWVGATGPEPGGGPEDWRGDSAGFGTDIGSRVGNAIVKENERGIRGLEFGGLSAQDEKDFQAALTAQRTTPSILSGQTGYYVPQGFDDFGAMSASGIQLFPNERSAPLSTQDFISAYSRPSKAVDQGILGLEAEREAVIDEVLARRRAEEFSGILAPQAPSVDQFEGIRTRQEERERAEEFTPFARKVPVDEFSDYRQQEAERHTEAVEEAQERRDNIRDSQAAEKASNKANAKSRAAQQRAEEAKGAAARANTAASKAKAQKAVNEAHKAMMAATTAGVKSITAKAKVSGGYQPSFKYTAGGGYTGGF